MPSRNLAPRKTPVQERSKTTRAIILEAAAQVFERHGYAQGTTNRIADRAGLSIGTVYQYFPNKDSILVALIEKHVVDGTVVLAPLLAHIRDTKPPLREALVAIIEAMVDLHRRQPGLHRVLFEEAPRPAGLQKQLDDLADAARGAVSEYLEARDEVTALDSHLAATLVVQVIESVTHTLVIHPETTDSWASELALETVELLDSYLTRPSAKRIAASAEDLGFDL